MMKKVFSPLRLPVPVTIRTIGCDGVSNAWYQREDKHPTLSICYEYLVRSDDEESLHSASSAGPGDDQDDRLRRGVECLVPARGQTPDAEHLLRIPGQI